MIAEDHPNDRTISFPHVAAELMGLSLLIAAAGLVFKARDPACGDCRECKDTKLRDVRIDVYYWLALYIIMIIIIIIVITIIVIIIYY